MKFLFFTDSHLKDKNPVSRIGDFKKDMFDKIDEIFNYAVKNDIRTIIHGGDIFDTPSVSNYILVELNKKLIKLTSKSIDFYVVAGNHDIYGRNPQTLDKTDLGLIKSLEALKILDRENTIKIYEREKIISIVGTPYIYNIDGKNKRWYLLNDYIKQDGEILVNIVHGMLMEKPFIKEVDHTVITEIAETKADLTISGHYHSGFELKEINGKKFINPGALARLSRSKDEIYRIPKFLECIIDSEGINIINHSLKCAKPGNEVIDKKELESIINNKNELNEFDRSIKESIKFNSVRYDKIMNDIALNNNVEEKVIIEARKRIEKAEEKLNDRY